MAPKRKTTTDEASCLTPRQIEILTLIRDGRRVNGFSPTLQELADELEISKITVFEHVEALLKKRMLTRRSNKARSLALTPSVRLPDERETLLPIVGRIAAGAPIEAIENSESLDLETVFSSRHPVAVLEVSGDSMIDEHIREGDLVVFEQRSNPRNGDTVVALIDGEDATLKKFYREKTRIRLQPANPKYRPIYSRNVEIQGVVIGVMRRY
jgi:repressor LexA